MIQESYKKENLEHIINYLNYNGPLFLRYISEYESVNQKRIPNLAVSIEV